MPRKLRLEYPGAIDHLMNRGDRREPIFKDDTDRRTFLDLLGQCCPRTGCWGSIGFPRTARPGGRALEQEVEPRRRAKDPEAYRPLRRGWFVGDSALRKELLEAMSSQAGAEHYGEELRRRKWKEADLERRPKGHSFKVGLAGRLREETTMTVEWIARRLSMGSRGHLTHLLYWQGRRKPKGR